MLLTPPTPRRGPRSAPVAFSLVVHLSVLAAVAFGPRPEKRQSAYQREIAPNEKKLVWYHFRDKLPDVSPAEPESPAAPLRAETHNPDQVIISKAANPDPAKQMTLAPAPELKIQPELAAPNLVAFEPPKPPPPKLFAPPQPKPRPVEQPVLPDAPALAAANRNTPAIPQPQLPKFTPKTFVPPQQVPKRAETPQLEPGEFRIIAKTPDIAPIAKYPVPARPQKAFTPPAQQPRTPERVELADAPALKAQASGAANLQMSLNVPGKPQPKTFTPPAQQANRPEAVALTADTPVLKAQTLAGAGIQTPLNVPGKPQPRAFTPPSSAAPVAADRPALEMAPAINVAVVSLNPVDRLTPVLPEVSRPAQFSAGPQVGPGPAGAPGESRGAVAPGLTIRNNLPKRDSIATLARVAPTSTQNLMAAAPPVVPVKAEAPPDPPPQPLMARRPPPERFSGRTVYTVALQMANVTSSSGSWILWYADRFQDGSDIREIAAPVPLHKVDPIYDLSAAAEKIEGKVQLSGVIHSDGYVYNIGIVSGIDPRLDQNAVSALRKWEFEPARRAGTPVDVDVVIEIPFRLRVLK